MTDVFEHIFTSDKNAIALYFNNVPDGVIHAVFMTPDIPDDLRHEVQVSRVDLSTHVWKFIDRHPNNMVVDEGTFIAGKFRVKIDIRNRIGPFAYALINAREQNPSSEFIAPLETLKREDGTLTAPNDLYFKGPPTGSTVVPKQLVFINDDVRQPKTINPDFAHGAVFESDISGRCDRSTITQYIAGRSYGLGMNTLEKQDTVDYAVHLLDKRSWHPVEKAFRLFRPSMYTVCKILFQLSSLLFGFLFFLSISDYGVIRLLIAPFFAIYLFFHRYVRKFTQTSGLTSWQAKYHQIGNAVAICRHARDLGGDYQARYRFTQESGRITRFTHVLEPQIRVLRDRCHTRWLVCPCLIPMPCAECALTAWSVRHSRDTNPVRDAVLIELRQYIRNIWFPYWFPDIANVVVTDDMKRNWFFSRPVKKRAVYSRFFDFLMVRGGPKGRQLGKLFCFQKLEKYNFEIALLGKAYRMIQHRPYLQKLIGPIVEAVMNIIKRHSWCVKSNTPTQRQEKLRNLFRDSTKTNLVDVDAESFDAFCQHSVMKMIFEEVLLRIAITNIDNNLFFADELYLGRGTIWEQKTMFKTIYAIYAILGTLYSGDAWTAFMGQVLTGVVWSFSLWKEMGKPPQEPSAYGNISINDGDDMVASVLKTINLERVRQFAQEVGPRLKIQISPSPHSVKFCSGIVMCDGSYMREPLKTMATIGYVQHAMSHTQLQEQRMAVALGMLAENVDVPIISQVAMSMMHMSTGYKPVMHSSSGFYHIDEYATTLGQDISKFLSEKLVQFGSSYSINVSYWKRVELARQFPFLTPERQIALERDISMKRTPGQTIIWGDPENDWVDNPDFAHACKHLNTACLSFG
jgi:hypothetical protein